MYRILTKSRDKIVGLSHGKGNLGEGKVSIGADADSDPASAAAIGFTVKASPRLFSRRQMRGM